MRSAISVALRVVLVVALLALAGLGLGPRTGAYRTLTVLSGSMRPLFGAGDVVIATPEPTRDLKVGQVITYSIPVGDHHVETHRVIRILKHGAHPVIWTKGDANPIRDPWTARLAQPTVWRQRWVIPYAGYLVMWLREPALRTLLVVLTPLFLAMVWLYEIWKPEDDAGKSLVDAA
jgi:signal peptidase I